MSGGAAVNYGVYALLLATVSLVAAWPVLGVAAGSLAAMVVNCQFQPLDLPGGRNGDSPSAAGSERRGRCRRRAARPVRQAMASHRPPVGQRPFPGQLNGTGERLWAGSCAWEPAIVPLPAQARFRPRGAGCWRGGRMAACFLL